MSNKINATFQIKRDTTENWKKNNPILLSGEICYDITDSSMRIGDGVTHWVDLPKWVTQRSTAEMIMNTYLTRDMINQWVAEASDYFVERALAPIMNGTYKLGTVVKGLPEYVQVNRGTAIHIDLSNAYAHEWAREGEGEILTGTFHVEMEGFMLMPGEYKCMVTFKPDDGGHETVITYIPVYVVENQ